jgi:outer membrane receptor protein involved in Fe transport
MILVTFVARAEEDTVSIAVRYRLPAEESPSAVTVITREQIENTHCTEIECLMRQVPGVEVRRVLPGYTVIGARALTNPYYGNRTLLIVDGREVNDAIFGIPLWPALSVHLEDIERIEIIRGPGSAMYGPDAHSMVVAVTTRRGSEGAARAFVGSGERDGSSLALRVGRSLGNLRLTLSGGLETGGHWRRIDEREKETGRVVLRADFETGESTSTVEVGFICYDGRIHTALAPADIPDTWAGHLLLSHRTEMLQAQVSFGIMDLGFGLELPLLYQGVEIGKFPERLHFFYSNLDAGVQTVWSPFSGNLLVAGGGYRWVTMFSEDLEPELSYEHRLGAYLHDQQRLFGGLLLVGSVRVDYNTITPFAVSPRLAAVWEFSSGQLVRLAFARAFRRPCFYNTSTHIKGVTAGAGFEGLGKFFLENIGNDRLGNESITVLEAGYRGRFLEGALDLDADVFYNRYRETIDFNFDIAYNQWGIPDFENSTLEFANQGADVDSLGGTLSVAYRPVEALRLDANYTCRHSWYVSDTPTADLTGRRGDRVPWEAAHLFNLSGTYSNELGLRAGLALHWRSASDLVIPKNGGLFDEEILVHSEPAAFFSGFLAWRVPAYGGWVEMGVRAYNLFHVAFRDTQAVRRLDGYEMGGELIGRRIFLFVRGSI